ncbi:hypothetical protein C8R45DRAFT_1110947 [Mycena sanguinolenta]|nr:hypothetical protein C8R45DRAFT_1110947 [Mycena sanguinolenta]
MSLRVNLTIKTWKTSLLSPLLEEVVGRSSERVASPEYSISALRSTPPDNGSEPLSKRPFLFFKALDESHTASRDMHSTCSSGTSTPSLLAAQLRQSALAVYSQLHRLWPIGSACAEDGTLRAPSRRLWILEGPPSSLSYSGRSLGPFALVTPARPPSSTRLQDLWIILAKGVPNLRLWALMIWASPNLFLHYTDAVRKVPRAGSLKFDV